MMSLSENEKVPDLTLPMDGGGEFSFKAARGKKIVLYFYPKDDTPGCTTEACDFRDEYAAFQGKDVIVLGVSKDPIKSHDKFKSKYELPFPLLSDEEGKLCEAFGVWVEKSMYGKKYMGIERATFILDEEGKIMKAWRKVSVPGHVKEVLAALGM